MQSSVILSLVLAFVVAARGADTTSETHAHGHGHGATSTDAAATDAATTDAAATETSSAAGHGHDASSTSSADSEVVTQISDGQIQATASASSSVISAQEFTNGAPKVIVGGGLAALVGLAALL